MKRMIAAMIGALLLTAAGVRAEDTGPVVRAAYLQSDIHHLAFWVALEEGYYRDAGVAVDVAGVFKAGPEIMSAFAAGALDMAYVGEAPSTTAVANRAADVVVVAQVNTEGSALVVSPKSAGLQRLTDLKGKTVAVPGHSTVQDFLLRRALREIGMAPDALNIMVLKPPEMIGALRTGQIDAFIAWEPYPSKSATMGVGRNLAASGTLWPGHPCCVLVSGRDFLASHPETVKAVVKVHVRATDFIHRHPEKAVAIGVQYTGMDEQTVRTAMKNVQYTPELSVEGEKEYVRFLTDLGYIQLENPDDFVEGFLRQDILREALHP